MVAHNKIRTLGRKVAAWFPRAIPHGEGLMEGQPFHLRDDQVEFCERWFAYRGTIGGDGFEWVFDRSYLETPKGVGKTMFKAALAVEHAVGPSSLVLGRQRPNIVVGATSIRQAGEKRGGKTKDDPEDFGDGIYGRICQIVGSETCPLFDDFKVFGDRITIQHKLGGIRLVAMRATTVDGGLPTLFIADEVQDWFGSAAEAHERIENSTTKAGGRSISGSTPGNYQGDLSVGWRLHRIGEQVAAGESDEPFLYVSHRAELGHDLENIEDRRAALLEATPGLEGDRRRLERLVRRYNEIDHGRYRRFHLGQWPKATKDSWLKDHPSAWENCQDADLEPSGPTWVAVDVSLRNDLTGVAWWSWDIDADGVKRRVSRGRKFEPGPSGVIDHSEVMQLLRDLHNDSNGLEVQAIGYDPRFFELPAVILADEGLPMVEFPQSPERMMPACNNAWDVIVGGEAAHNGDPDMALHVNSAMKREGQHGWTLSKQKSGVHIDLLIALVIAWWLPQAVKPNAKPIPGVSGGDETARALALEQIREAKANARKQLANT